MATYSYEPGNISANGVDRMRFELGDTEIAMGAISSPLCDEEYAATLGMYPDWRNAKIACLRAIVMKLAYEVDTEVSGLSYSLSQRYPRWKEMLDEEEEKLAGLTAVPRGKPEAIRGPHYFHTDLHANPRRFG